MAVQYRGQHQGLVQQRVDPLFIGLNANDAVLSERPRSISQQPDALQNILDDNRFEYIQFELAVGTSDRYGRVVTHNLSGNHSHGLTLCGVDLSRHNATARLVLRQAQLSQTTAGTRAEIPNVVSNLHQ